jgi:hypothetical protein
MKRRAFLASSLAASATASLIPSSARGEQAADPDPSSRDYYELRLYHVRQGPNVRLMDDFFRDAAIPAWNRIGVGPVGVFAVVIGPESPTFYVLLTHKSADSVLTAEDRLMADPEFLRAGARVINTPSSDPVYRRIESSVLRAFEAVPHIEVPEKRPRIFELRTYENHSKKANLKKIEMFETGEIAIFRRVGLQPVFMGEALAGVGLPNVTYMITFGSMEERQKNWSAFGADPAWKKLSTTPGYTDAEIVFSITNRILRPTPYSQV